MINAVYPDSEIIDILAGALIARVEKRTGAIAFWQQCLRSCSYFDRLGKQASSVLLTRIALAYLNTFKNDHFNSWGQLAGAAWGGYDPRNLI